MKKWVEIVIIVLKAVLALLGLLAGVASFLGGTSAGQAMLLGLDPTGWVWVLFGAFLVIGVLTWAFQLWRDRHGPSEDQLLEQILDFVEWLLEALKAETGRLLHEIPQSTVEEAARNVYRRFIAPSPLGALVSEETFVGMVVERWKYLGTLSGVQSVVSQTLQRVAS